MFLNGVCFDSQKKKKKKKSKTFAEHKGTTGWSTHKMGSPRDLILFSFFFN